MRKIFLKKVLPFWTVVAIAALGTSTQTHAANAAPVISNIDSSVLAINDNSTGSIPFSAATISDADADPILQLTISISPSGRGTLKSESFITDASGGSYTVSAASTSQLQSRLRTIQFIPTSNLVAPGSTTTATLGISISDGALTATANRSLEITSINDAPSVVVGSTLSLNDNQSNQAIFSAVTISDADLNQNATVTVTFDANKGSFANPGGTTFSFSGSGSNTVLTLPTQGFSSAQSALRALSFTPESNQVAVGQSESLDFAIAVSDGTESDTATKNVSVVSINDAPVLSPTTARSATISATATASPFGDISVTDADIESTSEPISRFTARIAISPSPYGSFNDGFFSTTSDNPAVFSYSGTRAQVQSAIRGASFVAPQTINTYTLTLTVLDSSDASSASVTATYNVRQPSPGMTGLQNGQTVADNSTISPFSTASFNNFGEGDRYIEITLDQDVKGTFENLGGFTKSPFPADSSNTFTYHMIANSTLATNTIRSLRFRPAANRIIGINETVGFNIKVRQVPSPINAVINPNDPDNPPQSTDQISVTVFPFNDAPTILGASQDIFINDQETAIPFTPISVADTDEAGNQTIQLNITLRGEDPVTKAPRNGGGILNPPAVTDKFTTSGTAPNITYRLTGTPAEVTSLLRSLIFVPDQFRNSIGQRETIRFTIAADDKKGGTSQYTQARVTVTTVTGAPEILGIPALALQPYAVPTITANQTMPFQGLAGFLIQDNDDSLTLTLQLDNAAKGTFQTTASFQNASPGVYTMTGSAEEITAQLQNLTYNIDPEYSFPADQPGLTTFTLNVSDGTNTTSAVYTIFTRERNSSRIVTNNGNEGDGSLRDAIQRANDGDTVVFDFADQDFPATITLDQPIPVLKDIQIVGSGVNKLSISGGDTTGLFIVAEGATLTLEQLTLCNGNAASYGGAVAVDVGSRLIARYCEFRANSAGQYGGAIDVFEGDLIVENCLFVDNHVTGTLADAGGAISVFSVFPSSIVNSTFVNNRQSNPSGLGGGAVYVQNSDISLFFPFHIRHCTFKDNTDSAGNAHAILSSSSGTRVNLANNILASTASPVINVIGGGRFVTAGGNIATDATTTTYQQGGTNITLLNHANDKRSTDPLIGNLAFHYGATRTCLPLVGSPAIDKAVSLASDITPGTDQRGFWRPTGTGSLRDIGAHEVSTFRRININEIHVNDVAGADFIEFYNPRDSEILDINGIRLWIDGTLVHTFGSNVLTPGSGFAWISPIDLNPEKGRIELRNAAGQLINAVDYAATFYDHNGLVNTDDVSINRYPRYEGGFLPHTLVESRITDISPGITENSPGDDVDGSPLGGGNAPPLAFASPEDLPSYTTYANEVLIPDVLANDIDFDRTDTLKITEIMSVSASGTVSNQELQNLSGDGQITLTDLPNSLKTIAPNGATVTISSDEKSIQYDPRASSLMIGLAEDQTITDVRGYSILDYNETDTPQSRGVDTSKKAANIEKATSWFAVTVVGVNESPTPVSDMAATRENHVLRLLANAPLLSSPGFSFGDLPENFQEFDATGSPVTLMPVHPTVAILENDNDVDSDDDKDTLILGAVHTTEVPSNLLEATSELGARVVLDIRENRNETNIVYDPRQSSYLNSLRDGEIATDSFYYSVFDRHGARGIAKIVITVTGVNDIPVARNDGTRFVYQKEMLPITHASLLANDSDIDTKTVGQSDEIVIKSVDTTSQLGATVALNGSTIVYDPRNVETFIRLARNETLTDHFDYTIDDGKGGITSATVSILVEGVNQAPVASADFLSILENQSSSRDALSGLAGNDIDVDINGTNPDDSPWIIPQREVITGLGAKLQINADGSFNYDANSTAIESLKAGQVVTETFPYVVIDNSRTVAADDQYKIFSNSNDVVLSVLLNDLIVGKEPVSISGYAEGSDGTLVIESSNHCMRDGMRIKLQGYSGSGNYNGVHAIKVISRDRFSIDVSYADNPPAQKGTWLPWFTITAVSNTSHGGSVAIIDGQNIQYTPVINFYGYETFQYTIEDGIGGQDVGTVGINVITEGLNGFVTASDDRFIIGRDAKNVSVSVLANDGILPAGSANLIISAVSAANGATGDLQITQGGKSLTYTPEAGFTGSESFVYEINGGGSLRDTATITFEVVNRENAIDAQPDEYVVISGSENNLFSVLANDAVLPQYPTIPTIVAINGSSQNATSDAGGAVAINNNQILYSAPSTGESDAFNYTIRDATGATTTRTVSVRIVNAQPNFYAADDHYMVAAGAETVTLPVLGNDVVQAIASAAANITALGIGTNAPPVPQRVSIVNGQFIRYTPPTSASTESFTYEIGIGTTERRSARVTITTVGSYATLPTARPDTFQVARNSGPHNVDILQNDIPYPDSGWRWIVANLGACSHGGEASIVNNGSYLEYKPSQDFVGIETLSYTIRDAMGNTSSATVTFEVGDMFTSPDHFTVLENSSAVNMPVLSNDNFLSIGSADYVISAVSPTSSQGATLSIQGSGPSNSVLYQPAADFSGTDTFTYTVVDSSGGTHDENVTVNVIEAISDRSNAILTVQVTGVNDSPVMTGLVDASINDKQTVNPFSAFEVSDVDENGNQLQTATFRFDPALGTVSAPAMTQIAPGHYSITATPSAVTTALRDVVFTPYENLPLYITPGQSLVEFALTIDDGAINPELSGLVTITVTGVNDAPIAQNDSTTTRENQSIRLMADATLLSSSGFDFGDRAADYLDFNGGNEKIALPPPHPSLSLLANDDDVDADDDKNSLLLGSVHTSSVPTNLLTTTSQLGAKITLDIRANRAETNIVYDPRNSDILNALPQGAIAEDSFYYSVFDRHGARGIAKVTIFVTGVNDLPMATDDKGFATKEDLTLVLDAPSLISNDSDPDDGEGGGPDEVLLISGVSPTSQLGAIITLDLAKQTIRFDPTNISIYQALARNEVIEDSFTYTTTDPSGGTSTATVRLSVEGVNDAPVAKTDLRPLSENTTSNIAAAAGLLSNDIDVDINGTIPDDSPWIIPQRGVTTPLGAALDINPDGSYRYDANSRAIDSLIQGQIATEIFPYTVIDNFRTQAVDDRFKVLASSANITLPVLANDSVIGANPVAIQSYSADGSGNLVIESANHSLRDGLLIRISDDSGDGSYNGVHAITSIDRNKFSIDVPYVDGLPNSNGTWMPWLEISSVSNGDKGGILSIAAGQNLTYTPTPGFYGTETFTYNIRDGVGGQDLAEVTIEVIRPEYNGDISASNDHYQIGMGESGVMVQVLLNDGISPGNGEFLTITEVSPIAGAAGTVAITNNGKSLSYTPSSENFVGSETFAYTVIGRDTTTATATVTFEVINRTGKLDGSDDDFFVVLGSSHNTLNVLANDPVMPSYPVDSTIVSTGGSPQGTVAISNNQLSYTPGNSIGTDTFTYTARDASGATVTRSVRVRVAAADSDFIATNDHYVVLAGSGELNLPILVNDGTISEPVGAIRVVNLGLDNNAPPEPSRVAIATDGQSIRYTAPSSGRTESFTYETSLGIPTDLRRRVATVTVTVVDAFATFPLATRDAFHVEKNSGPHQLNVLGNDLPLPLAGWSWTISEVEAPSHGGIVQITDGSSISYRPAVGFFGTESFSYRITDSFGRTSTAVAVIKVGSMETSPDRYTVLQNTTANSLPVLLNDDRLDGQSSTYEISSVSAAAVPGSVVSVRGNGSNNQLSYRPATNYTGEDSFTYTVVDKSGGTKVETVHVSVIPSTADRDQSTLTVRITGTNDIPVVEGLANRAISDKQTVKPFETVTISDLDSSGDQTQQATVVYNPNKGTMFAPGMSLISAGTYRIQGTPAAVTSALRAMIFTPFENIIDYVNPGSEEIAFQLSLTDFWITTPLQFTSVVTVTPINDAPTIIAPIPNQVVHVNAMPSVINLLFHFADVDDSVSGGQVSWAITQNSNPALFSSSVINPETKQLTFTYAPNQTGFSDITVKGTDRGGLSVQTSFRVIVEGVPVIVLPVGESSPTAASLISSSGSVRTYRQSFRIQNTGSLAVDSFIVHVTGMNQPISGILLINGEYSTNENNTLTNFADDNRSNIGVNRLAVSTSAQDVKYSVGIAPGSSAVVHLTYQASSINPISIRPSIRVSLTTATPQGAIGNTSLSRTPAGHMQITANLAANKSYQLQYSADLTSWSNWTTPIPASAFSRQVQFVDDGSVTQVPPAQSPRRFYRFMEIATP